MAAIDQPTPNQRSTQAKAGKKRRVRTHRFHLDMTPMVDLAFLLLTFFMLTTAFAKPRVMQLTMPVPDPLHPLDVPLSKAMTVVLGQNHRVYYYFGLHAPGDPSVALPTLYTTDFGPKGIRQALLTRQHKGDFMVLIKPSPQAKYQDMVDILDEMNITGQSKYAITELGAADRQLLPASERQ
ncbi:ExbD/TolR family protein [Hymenobacter sp. BRD67]|uniref:ExbD/TolR family protein n=1 Tax=Hymenobacter sp. BRD67 TaxID=2675877 RepID=UPI00156326C4|nr:biopolymer transporter ExbD [Hymenobacter sp. BRD67]QKG54155.1 biopolymer transporter ExbD [Hymenobacter sp. BRD67]